MTYKTPQKATEYLSQMTNECSLCGSHNLELIASFMTYITEFFYMSYTKDGTSGPGTAYDSEAPEFNTEF